MYSIIYTTENVPRYCLTLCHCHRSIIALLTIGLDCIHITSMHLLVDCTYVKVFFSIFRGFPREVQHGSHVQVPPLQTRPVTHSHRPLCCNFLIMSYRIKAISILFLHEFLNELHYLVIAVV